MGKAIAKRFADEGEKVVVSDMNIESAKQTVAKIEQNGGTAIAVLTNEDEIENLFNVTLKQYGHVNISVNNAGIMDNMLL